MRHVLIYTLRQNFSLEHIPTSIYVCRNVLIYLKSTALISLLMRSVICRRYKIKISTVANVIKLQELESRGIQAAKCKLTRMHRDIFYNLNLPHICMYSGHIYMYTAFCRKRKFAVEPLPLVSQQQRVLATNVFMALTADTILTANVLIQAAGTTTNAKHVVSTAASTNDCYRISRKILCEKLFVLRLGKAAHFFGFFLAVFYASGMVDYMP